MFTFSTKPLDVCSTTDRLSLIRVWTNLTKLFRTAENGEAGEEVVAGVAEVVEVAAVAAAAVVPQAARQRANPNQHPLLQPATPNHLTLPNLRSKPSGQPDSKLVLTTPRFARYVSAPFLNVISPNSRSAETKGLIESPLRSHSSSFRVLPEPSSFDANLDALIGLFASCVVFC